MFGLFPTVVSFRLRRFRFRELLQASVLVLELPQASVLVLELLQVSVLVWG